MKKWNQIVSLLMSAALLSGLSCVGAGAESDEPLGAGGAGSYVSWEDSQGAVSEADGQVTLTLTGGTVKLAASLLYFLQVVVNFFLFRRDSSLWQRLSLVPFALLLLISAVR